MFLGLNRITAPDLVSRIEAGGFRLIRKFETVSEKIPPEHLLNAYSESALRTEQIVTLFEKA